MTPGLGQHRPFLTEDDEVDAFIDANDVPAPSGNARRRLFAAFMTFGLLNNVLYVIILSAALDLVPPTTPKGIVAFFNIFPALIAKVCWPLISTGEIRYRRRVGFCTAISFFGILTVALSPTVHGRLFGISLASFSSGLGELTFLQLTTTLPNRPASKTAVGAWSSGTGFAGVAGAALWWLLRGLGVRGGLGISSVLPLCFPFTYKFVLPSWDELAVGAGSAYRALPTDEEGRHFDDEAETGETTAAPPPGSTVFGQHTAKVYLSPADKWELLKPLVLRYMVPLCLVYIEEYVINSGVAPTLVFPLPTSGPWSLLFKSPRDYYPFWSLTYQTFVFISRSSLSLGLPPIPRPLLPLPTIIQFFVLVLLALQSRSFIFSSPEYTPPHPEPISGVDRSITAVFLLTCLEGLCGGSAYVNTFYHVGHEGGEDEEGDGSSPKEVRRKMEREFRIGATGAADSTGILFASLVSMPLEIALCNAQVAQGRDTCRSL